MMNAEVETAISDVMDTMGAAARRAAAALTLTTNDERNAALRSAAVALRGRADKILAANASDMAAGKERGLSGAMLDRLMLDGARIEGMAAGVESVAGLPDPLGRVLAEWERPNGLKIQRVSVPLGVIGIIYESRPNVTADAAALCLKSGNVAILRGGSESFHSSRAIYECMRSGLQEAGIDPDAVQMVPTTDRAAVGYLLSSMSQWIDVVVPRGGKGLIKRVQDEARVPVIGHLEGICHVYLHEQADTDMARNIVLNAKMRRTGICGACETVLVDRSAAGRLLPAIAEALTGAGCEIRGDDDVRGLEDLVEQPWVQRRPAAALGRGGAVEFAGIEFAEDRAAARGLRRGRSHVGDRHLDREVEVRAARAIDDVDGAPAAEEARDLVEAAGGDVELRHVVRAAGDPATGDVAERLAEGGDADLWIGHLRVDPEHRPGHGDDQDQRGDDLQPVVGAQPFHGQDYGDPPGLWQVRRPWNGHIRGDLPVGQVPVGD